MSNSSLLNLPWCFSLLFVEPSSKAAVTHTVYQKCLMLCRCHLWTPPHTFTTSHVHREWIQVYTHRCQSDLKVSHPRRPAPQWYLGQCLLEVAGWANQVLAHGIILCVTVLWCIVKKLLLCNHPFCIFSLRWQCVLFVLAVSCDGSAVCCVSLGLRHHWL